MLPEFLINVEKPRKPLRPRDCIASGVRTDRKPAIQIFMRDIQIISSDPIPTPMEYSAINLMDALPELVTKRMISLSGLLTAQMDAEVLEARIGWPDTHPYSNRCRVTSPQSSIKRTRNNPSMPGQQSCHNVPPNTVSTAGICSCD